MTIQSDNIEIWRRLYSTLDLDIGAPQLGRRLMQTTIVPIIDVRQVIKDIRLVRGQVPNVGTNDVNTFISVPEDEEWEVYAFSVFASTGDRQMSLVWLSRPDETLQIGIDGGAASGQTTVHVVLPTAIRMSGLNIPDFGGLNAEGRPTALGMTTNAAGTTNSNYVFTALVSRFNIGRS
jgi:hypothetical protein